MPFVISTTLPPEHSYSASATLHFSLQTVEAVTNPYRLEKIPVLLIDNSEVAIRYVSWTGNQSTTGIRGNFTLARLSDYSLLTDGALITLQVKERDNIDDPWRTRDIFTDQKWESKSFVVADDTVSFATHPMNKLTQAPTENLIIVKDSEDAPQIDVDEVEGIPDESGVVFTTELLQITDLTLYDIFEEIFVNRCGFSSYNTDIEDMDVDIAHFPVARPYLEGIKPLIGTYQPRIYEINDVVYIKNGWTILPPDFPEPVDFSGPDNTVGTTNIEIVSERSFYDTVLLSYTQRNNYDYRETRYSIKTTDNGGSAFDGDLVTTVTTKVWYDYFLYGQSQPQNTEQGQLLITRYNGIDVLSNKVYEENNVFRYDSFGRQTSTTRTVKEKVPDPDNPGEFIWHEESRASFSALAYAQHPFDIRRSYLKTITHRESEIRVIDTSKPYGWNVTEGQFDQALSEAKRTGSMEEFTYSDMLPFRTLTDNFTPNRNGMVQFNRTAYDHIQQGEIFNRTESRVGDVSLNGQFGRTAQMYIYETEGGTKGDGFILDVAGGIIPLRILKPLCRVILKKLKTRNKKCNLNRIVPDFTVNLGTQFSAKDKVSNLQGKFVVDSYTFTCEVTNNGNVWDMQIAGSEM